MRGKSFRELAERIRDMQTLHEKMLANTFAALEQAAPAMALLLLEKLGAREQAAEWMAAPQSTFGGRNAYEVLADGETERVWDCLLGIRSRSSEPLSVPVRLKPGRRSDLRHG